MTVHWTLTDPATAETWAMPINPNEMSSPHPRKEIRTAYGIRAGLDRIRSFMTPPSMTAWQWSGVIRTKAHYDSYEYWAKKPGVVHVTDHLGRTFEVFIQAFEPEDRSPTATTPWRLRYVVKTLLVGRIS